MIHGINALFHNFCTLYPAQPIFFYNLFHIKHFLIIYFTFILSLCEIFNKVLLVFSPYCNKYRVYILFFIHNCTNSFIVLIYLFLNLPHLTNLSGSFGSFPSVSIIAPASYTFIHALHLVHSELSIICIYPDLPSIQSTGH